MIERPATLENLRCFVEQAGKSAAAAGLPPSIASRVELCVEEVVANIVNHAYPEAEGSARMECSVDGEEFVVTISDDGVPFNMLEHPEPDLEASAEDRKIGGLGVFIVKTLMDSVEYKRDDGSNILVLRQKLRPRA